MGTNAEYAGACCGRRFTTNRQLKKHRVLDHPRAEGKAVGETYQAGGRTFMLERLWNDRRNPDASG